MLFAIDLHENLIDEEGIAAASMALVGIHPPSLSIWGSYVGNTPVTAFA